MKNAFFDITGHNKDDWHDDPLKKLVDLIRRAQIKKLNDEAKIFMRMGFKVDELIRVQYMRFGIIVEEHIVPKKMVEHGK